MLTEPLPAEAARVLAWLVRLFFELLIVLAIALFELAELRHQAANALAPSRSTRGSPG